MQYSHCVPAVVRVTFIVRLSQYFASSVKLVTSSSSSTSQQYSFASAVVLRIKHYSVSLYPAWRLKRSWFHLLLIESTLQFWLDFGSLLKSVQGYKIYRKPYSRWSTDWTGLFENVMCCRCYIACCQGFNLTTGCFLLDLSFIVTHIQTLCSMWKIHNIECLHSCSSKCTITGRYTNSE